MKEIMLDLILEKKGQYKEEIKKLAQELSDEKLYGSETASGLMSRGEYANNNSTQQYTSFDN